MTEGLATAFVGVFVGLSREREQASSYQRFDYRTGDHEVDSMILEDLRAYVKGCHDGCFEVAYHDRESI